MLAELIDWAGGEQEFYQATGIRPGDQRHYRNGTKQIRMARLRRAAEQIFGTPPAFLPIVEREALPARLPNALAGKAGVYAFFSSTGSLVYFGKATNLLTEINQTLGRQTPQTLIAGTTKAKYRFRDVVGYYSAYEVTRGDRAFRHDLESLVLRVVRRDTLNSWGGHFQRKG